MDNDNWIEMAIDCCSQAGISCDTVEIIATWDQQYCANTIYRINDQHFLKLFGPTAERQFHVERSVLRTLEDNLDIPAPRIVAEGERIPRQPFLIISAVPGDTAEHVWDNASRSEQLAIARDLGTVTAAIHRMPTNDLAVIESQFGGMNDIVDSYVEHRVKRIQMEETLSSQQRNTLIQFMSGEARELVADPVTMTHSELANNHLYLSRKTGKLRLSGIIDWADAWIGPAELDIVYLWFWTFSGDREAMRVCLNEHYTDSKTPEQFARRCLAALILTSSFGLLLPQIARHSSASEPVIIEMIESLFPPEVFGSPDE